MAIALIPPVVTYTSGDSTFSRDAETGIYKLLGTKKSVTPASTLNAQSSLKNIQRNQLADGNPIPLIYGNAQVGGMPFAIDYDSGTWTVGYIVCYGEIEGFESVLINGAAPVSGVEINYYTGTTSQTADALLAAAIDNYADTLVISDPAGDIGVAYIVIQYTDAMYDTWPQVLVEIDGKKVWNPKTSTTVYSANPALHLGDLISSPIYGLGWAVDDTALEAAQDYCDDTTPGEARREGYTVIDSAQGTTEAVDVLRTYASCFVVYRGDTCYLVPDKAASSAMTITADDIERDSIRITKKDSGDVPTVIRAYYTDTSGDEWREKLCDPAKAAGVDSGATPWRESRIRLTGVNRHSQAYRECIERLNKLTLSDLEVSWTQFDEALELEAGDVVTLTHPYGLDSKLLRLVDEPRQTSPGRWAMRGVEYDPAAYSDEVATQPTYADGNLPSGGIPGAPTGLTLGEYNYQLQNGEYASRITMSWTAPDTFAVGYNVEVYNGSTLAWSGNTANTEATTSPLKEGVLYTVNVKAYNALYTGSAVSGDYTIVGKTAIPGPVTGLTGFEAGGEVRLWWVAPAAASDFDVRRYEVRYYTTSETWDDGTVIDQVDSLRIVSRDVPAGTWRFGVKSIDSIRQYSTDAAEIDITVTLDVNAFRAGNVDPISTHAQLVYMYEDQVTSQSRTDYYSDGNDSWASTFASAMSAYTNAVASYQSEQGTSYWYSEVLDLLQDQAGTFSAEIDYEDIDGTATVELGLKPEGGSYTWGTNLSQRGTARYLQVRVFSDGIFKVSTPDGFIHADIVAREETGISTSSASTYKRITLSGQYAAVRSIILTPQSSTPRVAVFDNLIYGGVTSFDVYIFDNSGTQVASNFAWQFSGV